MELGIIGLGKMGFNMAERLKLAGHKVVGFDFSKDATAKLTASGSLGVDSLEDLVKNLSAPRAVWIMVPSGDPVDHTIASLEGLLSKGDTIIDGATPTTKTPNAARAGHHHRPRVRRLRYLRWIWGLKEGYSLMIGGDKAQSSVSPPIFQALAPSPTEGWGHVGPSGAGHFVKMVHNGIEYGMMQAYAEGFSILEAKDPLHLNLPRSPASGRRAPSSAPGCSTSPPTHSRRIPPSKVSRPGFRTPAKAAGPSWRPSTSTSPRLSSPNRSSAASVRAKATTSPTA